MATFYNRATLTYAGSVIDSNTVQGELNAALAVAKAAVNDRYRPGDAVSFAVTLTNSGASDASDLQLRDDLGAYAFGAVTRAPLEYVEGSLKLFVNGELQPAPAAETGADGLTIRGIRVPADGDAAILYAARVNEFAPLGEGAAIVNTVRLDDAASVGIPGSGNGATGGSGSAANSGGANANANMGGNNANAAGGATGGNAANNGDANAAAGDIANANATGNGNANATNAAACSNASAAMVRAAALPTEVGAPVLPAFASAVIAPAMEPRLAIVKKLNPETVSPGEELTYTLRIENSGATAVSGAEGAIVRDSFNPRMNIASVRFNGAPWSAPANYSYDAAEGTFATAAGQLEVPAATFSQDAATGRWQVQPGVATIEIAGTLR